MADLQIRRGFPEYFDITVQTLIHTPKPRIFFLFIFGRWGGKGIRKDSAFMRSVIQIETCLTP